MNRLERLYAITEAIRRRSPDPISAGHLAEDFGVTRRTIERDLATLRAAGVPIYAEQGRTGGQLSLDRPGNVVLTLSSAEVSALLIALAASGDDMPFIDAGNTATKRLLDSLGPTTRLGVEELRSRIRTQARDLPPLTRRTRRTLEEAVRRSVVVNIDYTDAHDNQTSRSVEAIGFYNGGDGWYLIGWCRLRQNGRIFRLDRVRRARLTKEPCGDRDVDETLGWVPHELVVP